jgi:hypothetical protein
VSWFLTKPSCKSFNQNKSVLFIGKLQILLKTGKIFSKIDNVATRFSKVRLFWVKVQYRIHFFFGSDFPNNNRSIKFK